MIQSRHKLKKGSVWPETTCQCKYSNLFWGIQFKIDSFLNYANKQTNKQINKKPKPRKSQLCTGWNNYGLQWWDSIIWLLYLWFYRVRVRHKCLSDLCKIVSEKNSWSMKNTFVLCLCRQIISKFYFFYLCIRKTFWKWKEARNMPKVIFGKVKVCKEVAWLTTFKVTVKSGKCWYWKWSHLCKLMICYQQKSCCII